MPEIDVKPFEQETEKAVVRINSQAFAARCREPAEVYKYREISAQDLRDCVKDLTENLWLACINDEPVGFVLKTTGRLKV